MNDEESKQEAAGESADERARKHEELLVTPAALLPARAFMSLVEAIVPFFMDEWLRKIDARHDAAEARFDRRTRAVRGDWFGAIDARDPRMIAAHFMGQSMEISFSESATRSSSSAEAATRAADLAEAFVAEWQRRFPAPAADVVEPVRVIERISRD